MLNQNSRIPLPNPNLSVAIPEQDLSHVMLLSGMGTDTADGNIRLKRSWQFDDTNAVGIDFDLKKQKPLFDSMIASMRNLALHIGEGGAKSFSTPFWDSNNVDGSSTVVLHPLGGCVMGTDNTNGVVNSYGEVFDCSGGDDDETKTYQGLYVVDGAIVPSSLGVNSSLTISALAMRIAQNCVGEQNLPVQKVIIDGETRYFPK